MNAPTELEPNETAVDCYPEQTSEPDAVAPFVGSDSELPGKLAGLTVWQQVRALAVWPFFEQLLSFCVGFVDTAIAGRLSVAATEAIAVGAYIGWLLTLMFSAVGIGAGALVARGIGGRNRRLAKAALGQALMATACLGALLAIAVWFACPSICRAMFLTAESNAIAVNYLRWMGIGCPALGILLVGSACLRNAGDMRTPFLVLAFINVVNVVVSLTLVFGPNRHFGASGIAIGTAAAWAVGAIIILLRLRSRKSVVRLHRHRLRPHLVTLRRIVRVSGPQFLDSLALWTGNFLLVRIVGYIGSMEQTGALAAHIVAIRLEAISYLPGWAMGQAAGTLVGQYLGLRDPCRARQAAGYCWLIAVAMMGTMGILFMTIPEALVGFVTREPLLFEMVPPILRVCGPTQVFFATVIVLENAVRGAGDTRPVALRVMFSTFCVRLPAAYLAGIVFNAGVRGIWIAMCCELVFRSMLISYYFLRGRWMRFEV